MKTAHTKTLLLGWLLLFCLAIGCSQQVEKSVEFTSGTNSEGSGQEIDQRDTTLEEELESAPEEGEDSLPIHGSLEYSVPQQKSSDTNKQGSSATEIEDAGSDAEGDVASIARQAETPAEPTIDIPATWKRLSETQEIWVDTKNKQVIVGGKVCLNAGPLEMLICPKHTKEHESIVSVNAESWQVDAALQAVGAEKGVPSRWAPEYTPAWGSKIDVKMMWRDEETKQVKTIDGKQWILNIDTQKPMTTELVFGGSYSEPQVEGEKARYMADAGELICLANFSTSTIDLQVSEENIDIFFEANAPLIPPINTQVYTIITPGPVIGKPEE